MSDREIDLLLVERVREGDKQAFGLLVQSESTLSPGSSRVPGLIAAFRSLQSVLAP